MHAVVFTAAIATLIWTPVLIDAAGVVTERARMVEKVSPQEVITAILNSSYDRRIRPPNRDRRGKNGPVIVDVDIYVRSMSNIDFSKMQYNLHLTFRQYWTDPRLAYEDLFPGSKVPKFIIVTDKDVIWTPDTFFLNEKQAHRHEIDKLNMMIRIHANGTIMYSARLSLTLSCPMYLQRYPMDQQSCSLFLASYAFTTDDIVYQWRTDHPIQYHPQLNSSLPNFYLDEAQTLGCTSKTTTGEYSCIQTTFSMRRMFRYYLAEVYVPSTLLVVVSWVSFWLERTAVPARVSLGVTTLLTMTTQAAAINNKLPTVSYLKAVDVWVATCLAFIFATVVEFALVSYKASMTNACGPGSRKSTVSSPTKDNIQIEESRKDSWGANKGQEMKLLAKEVMKKRKDLNFWKRWKIGADEPKMIDLRSRILFPALFILFNFIYWTWYSFL